MTRKVAVPDAQSTTNTRPSRPENSYNCSSHKSKAQLFIFEEFSTHSDNIYVEDASELKHTHTLCPLNVKVRVV